RGCSSRRSSTSSRSATGFRERATGTGPCRLRRRTRSGDHRAGPAIGGTGPRDSKAGRRLRVVKPAPRRVPPCRVVLHLSWGKPAEPGNLSSSVNWRPSCRAGDAGGPGPLVRLDRAVRLPRPRLRVARSLDLADAPRDFVAALGGEHGPESRLSLGFI